MENTDEKVAHYLQTSKKPRWILEQLIGAATLKLPHTAHALMEIGSLHKDIPGLSDELAVQFHNAEKNRLMHNFEASGLSTRLDTLLAFDPKDMPPVAIDSLAALAQGVHSGADHREAMKALKLVAASSPHAMDKLAALTKETSKDISETARASLVDLSESSPLAVDKLLQLGVREHEALEQLIDQDTAVVINRLLELSGEKDSVNRLSAIRKLGHVGGSLIHDVIPRLLELSKDANSEVRRATIYAFKKLGERAGPPVVDRLLEMSKETDVGRPAREALSVFGKNLNPVLREKMFLELSADSKPKVRAAIATSFEWSDATSAETERLFELLKDSHIQVQSAAADALGKLGKKAALPVVDKLRELAKADNTDHAIGAISALGNLGQEATSEVINTLFDLYEKSNAVVSRAAENGLIRLHSKGVTAVIENFLKLAEDPNHIVRGSAVTSLGRMGEDSGSVVLDKLLQLGKDPNRYVRSSVAYAFGRLGKNITPVTLDTLLKMSTDTDKSVRIGAVTALGTLSDRVTPAIVARMLEMSKDPDSDVTREAIGALGNLGSKVNPQVVQRLVEFTKSGNQQHRGEAVKSISKLGESGSPAAVDGLIALTKDRSYSGEIQGPAIETLVAFAKKGTPLGSFGLIELSKSSDPLIVFRAVKASASVGKKAPPALIDRLFEITNEPDPHDQMRMEAINSLTEISISVVVARHKELNYSWEAFRPVFLKLRNLGVSESIIHLLHHPRVEIRELAWRALSEIVKD